jgi:hypothetical protein
MTSQEFVALSVKLFNDMKTWIEEASKGESLSPSDLALLNSAINILERVTLLEADRKPETAN